MNVQIDSKNFLNTYIDLAFKTVISGISNKYAQLFGAKSGNRYQICFFNRNGYKLSTKFNLTYQHNNIRYVVGQRKYFASFYEAYVMTNLWMGLLLNASTRSGWAKFITAIEIVDLHNGEVVYSIKK